MIFVTVGTHEQPFNRLIQKVDHFDTEAFAKKVVEILKQPEQRKQMGKCAIERSQDFSLEKVLPLFKQYLEEAAKGL